MAKYPDIQRKVRQEIHEKIGESRLPAMTDRVSIKYTDGVLAEIQRFGSVVPLSIAHLATSEVKLGPYNLPSETIILPNLFAAHRQRDIWPDPDNFNPEANFMKLGPNGEVIDLINHEYLMPFCVGKRSCLGETLAKQELFLFFVGLLQKFEFLQPPSEQLPAVNLGLPGLIRQPPRYHICLKV